jgi:hypothetical protein
MGGGFGLAPKQGYGILSMTFTMVPGYIKNETIKCSEVITTDECVEKKFKAIIEEEQGLDQTYNLVSHNCYHWASYVEQKAMGN